MRTEITVAPTATPANPPLVGPLPIVLRASSNDEAAVGLVVKTVVDWLMEGVSLCRLFGQLRTPFKEDCAELVMRTASI